MNDREPTDPEEFAAIVDGLVADERADTDLKPYMESVEKLREAGKSYRFIATLLSEHGIECDHNTLWRAYNKWAGSEDAEAHEDGVESERAAEEEDQAAQDRNAQ